MTMLTHPRSEPASYLPGRRESADTTANLATLKQFSLRAVGVLLAGGAVAGVIALKAAIFLSRINY
jgi:hypothetical protein